MLTALPLFTSGLCHAELVPTEHDEELNSQRGAAEPGSEQTVTPSVPVLFCEKFYAKSDP